MADETINITFTGSAAGLQHAAQQVAQALNNVTAQTKQMSTQSMAAGVAVGTVMATVGASALRFAKDVVGSFSSVTAEVRRMQGVMGGSAEEISRLRHAGSELGVSSAAIARGYRMLSAHLNENDKALKALGVSFSDVRGAMDAPTEVIALISERLNQLPKGAERSALAAKLFGRSFMELNPLLSAGSEQLKKLTAEADAFGLVVSEKDLKVAKQWKMSSDALKDGLHGLAVTIGSAVMPTLALLAQSMEDGVIAVRSFFSESETAQTVLKVVAGTAVFATAAFAVYNGVLLATAAASKIAAVAQGIWNTVTIIGIGVSEGLTGAIAALNIVMEANPIGFVVTAVMLLITAFIGLIRASDTFRNAFARTMQIIGSVVGYVVAGIILALKGIVDGFGFVVKAAANFASWMGRTFNIGWLKKAGESVNTFVDTVSDGLQSAADSARKNGGKIGRAIGEGVGNAIKNFKLPSLKLPDMKLPDMGGGGAGGSGGGKTGLDKAAEAAKKFWQARIDAAKYALDQAKAAAKEAKDKMTDYAKNIADTVRGALDITRLTETSFAQYLGADALIAAFRKKLGDTKEFVKALKDLREQGLPLPMLQQIAAAGVDGGLAAARLLVGNAGAIASLRDIQAEIDAQAVSAGATLSEATYGAEVASKEGAIAPAQAVLTGEVKAAREAGMTVTEETTPSGDINISVDVATDADPQDIADAVAFGMKSGTKPVVKKKVSSVKKTPAGSSIKRTVPAGGGGLRFTYR